MKNKNLLFGLSAMVLAIGCFWSSFTSATSFKLEIEKVNAYWKSMANRIIPVHFADNWNDFGGFLYFSNGGNIVQEDDCNGSEGDGTCDDEYESQEDTESTSGEMYKYKVEDTEDVKYECKTQVKWFYYNAERGERLRPLDEETWASIEAWYNLTTEGGIFTDCRKAWYVAAYEACENITCDPEEEDCEDADSCTMQVDKDYPANKWYFGQVKHTYKGQEFGFVVWTNYVNVNNNPWFEIWKKSGELLNEVSFISFTNGINLWFVYDYNGWLWFAWCEIKQSTNKKAMLNKLLSNRNSLEDIATLFEDNHKWWIKYIGVEGTKAVDCENIWMGASLIKLIIEWLIGMNRESDNLSEINQQYVKMQYFSSSDINNATLLNYVKQRSETLCRWKWQSNADNYETKFSKSNIVCLDFQNNWTVGTDMSGWTKENGKTLIVKNADVLVDPSSSETDSKNYDIFINGGNLIINEDTNTPKFVFTTQGFVANETIGNFKDTLEGIYSSQGSYTWEYSGVWSLIRGNFVVDGHVKGNTTNGKLNNKYFIHWKFTTKDSTKDLEETFAWRCSDGYVVDKGWHILDAQWKFCPTSIAKRDEGDGEAEYEWYNPYEWASLVVIDQNYNSPLYW